MEVVASLSQGRTAAAQCGLFTYKSVAVIFEPPCTRKSQRYRTEILQTEKLHHEQLGHIHQGNNNIYTQAYLLARTFSSSSRYHITYKDSSTWATPHLLKYHVPANKTDTTNFYNGFKNEVFCIYNYSTNLL